MQSVQKVAAVAALLVVGAIGAKNVREPLLQSPGLLPTGALATDTIVSLTQGDFDSGTYRIQTPGYYYLAENISFEPIPSAEAGRADKPVTAWFAAISIECENVVLDLNTKTLDMSQDFIDTHSFKVFSLIELNNSPFPHFVFAFQDATTLAIAKNVVIRNGTLGRSSHHGIHGNSNSNIRMYDLVIRDWEVAGISLNGLKNSEVRNVTISGIEHPVPFSGLITVMKTALLELEVLLTNSDAGAQQYVDALTPVINDPAQNGQDMTAAKHDSIAYGLRISNAVNVGPVLSDHPTLATSDCVLIENVVVCNMQSRVLETVGMRDSEGTLLKGQRFGALRWVDAYSTGTFVPNALIQAQVYTFEQNNPSTYPSGFATNILSGTPNEATFLGQVTPAFGFDFAGHKAKGIFGIRIDGGHGITLRNCHVISLDNEGALGTTLATLPAGSNYSASAVEERFHGNDVYGILLAGCHGCLLENCSSTNCESDNGYVEGISIVGDSSANKVISCCVNALAGLADNPGSIVNPPARVAGVYVDNNSDGNVFDALRVQLLQSPRDAYGYLVSGCQCNVFSDCDAREISATATWGLTNAKEAAGFKASGSTGSAFRSCEAACVQITGEDNETAQSSSIAAGFMLSNSDARSEITDSRSHAHDGGAGTGVGIVLTAPQNATVHGNKVYDNHSANAVGNGYGIQGTLADSSLIIQNIGHGNSTSNFLVSYANAANSLPVSFCSYFGGPIGSFDARANISYQS